MEGPNRMSTPLDQTAEPSKEAVKPDVGVISPSDPSPHDDAAASSLGRDSLAEHHLRFAEEQSAYIATYIQLADTKASWIFAAASALIAFVITSTDTQDVLSSQENSLSYFVILCSLGLLIVSAIFAFRVIAPRLRSSNSRGLYFFGSTARHPDGQAYLKAIANCSFDQLASERIQHNFDIARVCVQKYRNLKPAFWCGAIGVILLAAFLVGHITKRQPPTSLEDPRTSPPVSLEGTDGNPGARPTNDSGTPHT